MAQNHSKTRTRGRSPRKQNRVVSALRQEIVSGRLKPASQLPAQPDLAKQYRVSTVTIQRAIRRLVKEGFLVSHPRQGVFVDAKPPHRVDYCLIFPHDEATMARENRFLFSLSKLAQTFSREGSKGAIVYLNVFGPDNSQGYQDLLSRVLSHRTAGLVFLSSPHNFLNSPILTEPDIPRVAIAQPKRWPDIRCVMTGGFMDRALPWLAEQACRRVGILTIPGAMPDQIDAWIRSAGELGMTLEPHHVLAAPPSDARWANAAIRAMMQAPADERPDGLVITDDNLVPHATMGLLATGLQFPEDCRVAVHANFPWVTDCVVPAQRFGPNVHEVFRACIRLIDQARQGQDVPDTITVSAISQQEFEQNAAEPSLQPLRG